MKFDLFTYLTSVAFIYVYGRLAIHFAPVIFSYFLNSPSAFQSQVEKPRLLFHLTGLSIMHLMYASSETYITKTFLFQVFILMVFILGIFFCQISWTKKFVYSFIPQVKKAADRSSENFNLSISEPQLTQLYDELVRFDLLNQDFTSIEDFKNVLLKNWNEHDSKLHLKMDGPSCREFYDYLSRTYPKNTMTLKNFFVASGVVLRPDGKTYNYNTIKNAPTRTPVSKGNETLVSIFSKII